jgi:hypothetical protein
MATLPPAPAGKVAGSVGLTVEVVNDATAVGVEFRSGWQSDFPWIAPEQPIARVEVVIGRASTLDQAALDSLISGVAVPAISAPIGVTGATLTITVSAVQAILDPPRIRLKAIGTADVSGGPLGSASATFAAEVPVTLGLIASPDAETVFDLQHVGAPSLEIGGPLEAVLAPGHDLFVQLMADQAAPAFARALDLALPDVLAKAFRLEALPPGSTPSLRSLEVTRTGLSFGPTLGAFGETLSRYVEERGVP